MDNIRQLKNILFLDIEIVSEHKHFEELDERVKAEWARKASYLRQSEEQPIEEFYLDRAGIYAEFGKIVTISLGYFNLSSDDAPEFRVKAIFGHDEQKLLKEFKEVLLKMDQDSLKLCAHNGREFDFPYISRRMLINEIPLPSALNLSGKKPWEVNHLDTMDMWKFGDWKHYSSLELLASIFNIESSKSGMDGSMVNSAYYEEDQLEEIAQYCNQDVIVTAQLYLKLKSIKVKNLVFIDTNSNEHLGSRQS